ncbi:MAG: hypothetical protein ACQERM_06485 [Methanobacteriota archaeon]
MNSPSESDYDDSTSRRRFLTGATSLGATALAGCGDDPSGQNDSASPDNGSNSGETQEPELQDVNLILEPKSEKADFTQTEQYALGLTARLEYSDGSTETRELTDYEVENASVRKTSEDGEYGVENVEFTEFSDADLRKAGHLYEVEDLDIQDGQIILGSDDLITGYSQIDLDINVTDEEISQYTDSSQYQNIIQVNKPEEQALNDLQVQGPEAIELWQKYREIRAEEIMEDQIISSSQKFDNYAEFNDVVRERVQEQLADEDNPDIQTELGHWGTEFGFLFMEENNGVSPSGATGILSDTLAEAAFLTSDINVIPGRIFDNGHNSNPVYVPETNDPSDEEYWDGKTFNVNTQLEDAAHPPDQLVNYTRGPFGQMFKRPEKDKDLATATFTSFMDLSFEDKKFNQDYALTLVDELGEDTELWQENLQHIMETAVGNLFSTENDLVPTGTAENPDVELS